MKKLSLTLSSVLGLVFATSLQAQTTAFTYQGRLSDSNGPVTGVYDLTFRAFAALTGGSQVGGTAITNGLAVSNGLFTVTIDLGPGVFTAADRWLEIAIRTNAAASFTTNSPRQALTPTPYAFYAGTAGTATNVTAGGVATTSLQNNSVTLGKLADGVLNPSNFPPNSVTSIQLADNIALGNTNAGGQLDVYRTSSNTPAISLFGNASQISTYGSDGLEQIRLWGVSWGEILLHNSLANNAIAATLSANGGNGGILSLGNSNGATRASLSGDNLGGSLSLYNPAGEQRALLASAGISWLNAGNVGIGKPNPNTLLDIAGNTTVDGSLTVDALNANADGAYTPGLSFGGFGSGESISSQRGTVGPTRFGLSFFTSFQPRITIGNDGSVGIGTTTPVDAILDIEGNARINDHDIFMRTGSDRGHGVGYRQNVAGFGFVDGPFVYGFDGGALGVSGPDNAIFVWDFRGNAWLSNDLNLATMNVRGAAISFGAQTRQMINLWNSEYGIGVQSSTEYFRTGGGFAWYRGGSHNDAQNNAGGGSLLMRLDGAGNLFASGSINPPSDRNIKENFLPINSREVLDKVAALPITRWNYTNDSPRTTHLGPVAQDFHAAFGLGTDDRHIATVDADGVALAAIQGLNQKVDSENASLRAQLKQREEDNADLRLRLEKLEKLLQRQ